MQGESAPSVDPAAMRPDSAAGQVRQRITAASRGRLTKAYLPNLYGGQIVDRPGAVAVARNTRRG